jgi:hypothetical protein
MRVIECIHESAAALTIESLPPLNHEKRRHGYPIGTQREAGGLLNHEKRCHGSLLSRFLKTAMQENGVALMEASGAPAGASTGRGFMSWTARPTSTPRSRGRPSYQLQLHPEDVKIAIIR